MEGSIHFIHSAQMPTGPGSDVSLEDLICEFGDICLGTRGRMRRLNRYLMGCDMILRVTPEHLRADAELRLTQIALNCGLLNPVADQVQTGLSDLSVRRMARFRRQSPDGAERASTDLSISRLAGNPDGHVLSKSDRPAVTQLR